MKCMNANPNDALARYVACFPTIGEAAVAAGVSREQLRKMRRRGHVPTRDRALVMYEACRRRVAPADLMDLPKKGRAA